MSRFQRVNQWSTFSKSWHLYDAKWQNPFQSARKLTPVLEGKSKPIYSPNVECGDHVVIINSRHISLIGREWKFRVYFHHPGYNKSFPGGGAQWIPAWQLHSKDPTLVMWKACYHNLSGGLQRKSFMAQLHVYPDGIDTVPEEILNSISGQIEPVRPIPKKLNEFTTEEIENFPKFMDFPEEYVIK